jgi:hypothetical protein
VNKKRKHLNEKKSLMMFLRINFSSFKAIKNENLIFTQNNSTELMEFHQKYLNVNQKKSFLKHTLSSEEK